MRKVVFDIETKNEFREIGKADPALLDISVLAYYDSEADDYFCVTEDELSKFWPIVEKADVLIGFNSDHFDIPLLNKYYPGDLSLIKSLDLLKEIKNSLGRRVKLDSIAEGTLGRKKSGHGLEAITWWKAGEIDKVKSYCIEDVRITKEVYDFAAANKMLKCKEAADEFIIKLDTSAWEEKQPTTMAFTLPF
jgi:DEAD/DEAH box helicase domain-containing protein